MKNKKCFGNKGNGEGQNETEYPMEKTKKQKK